MYNYDLINGVASTMFDIPKRFDFGELAIQRPDNLPLEVDSKLSRYNEAIKRFDIQEAEQAADEILEWLHCNGSAELI